MLFNINVHVIDINEWLLGVLFNINVDVSDINECERDMCTQTLTCINTEGSYVCLNVTKQQASEYPSITILSLLVWQCLVYNISLYVWKYNISMYMEVPYLCV